MNIKEVAKAALRRSEAVLARWLPDGKRQGSEWVALNKTRTDSKPGSFSVNIDTGRWADFASGDTGGDMVALVAYLDGCKQSEASKRVADFLGITESSPPAESKQGQSALRAGNTKLVHKPNPEALIIPIPAQAGPPPAAHPRHGKPSEIWEYRNAEGQVLSYVCRFDKKDGAKQILPMTWGPNGWQWKGVPAPRPLYNLDKLAARPDAPVMVSEGEKAADAAAGLFLGYVATTSPNGSKAAAKAAWSPLTGRRVFIFPDADKPGAAYAEEVAQLAFRAGAESVAILDPQAFSINKSTGKAETRKQPSGWDAADAVVDGWTAEDVIKLEKSGKLFRNVSPEIKTDHNERLPRFELRDDGVYHLGIAYNKYLKDYEPMPPLWVCSPLRVTAYTRNETSEDWGRLLEFSDRDGRDHRWAMPMSLLAGSGEGIRGELLRMGVEITTHQKGRLLLGDYLQNEKPETRARCVTRTGWHGGVFVFPERTLGETDEIFVFQSESMAGFTYSEYGKLDAWRSEAAALCAGNSRLTFAMAAGFASLLLGLTGDESGGDRQLQP